MHKSILTEMIRVSPMIFYNISIVTGSKRAFFKLIGDFSKYLKEIIVWDKGNGQPAMHDGVLNRRSELILVFDKYNSISREFKDSNFPRGTLDDVFEIKREKSLMNNHRAVFPTELVRKILLNFTKEHDIIYDPFLGTGTTAVVAKELNRYYLGSEISKEYFDFAKQRISQSFDF